MKALAINGSPRKGGNTEILLRKVLEPLAAAGHKTEYVQVGGTRIRGCTACGACGRLKNKRCVIEDDIFNLAFAKMLEADAIVIGSPVYFADVTAETKALIDRAGRVARTNGGLLWRKIGGRSWRRAAAVRSTPWTRSTTSSWPTRWSCRVRPTGISAWGAIRATCWPTRKA
jgi:multimeric flavodoxin WrbA